MINNKNYFNQYGLSDDISIYYSKILFWFRNMIKYLEVIIPKKITNSKLEVVIVCLYYKYYKKKYKENLILFSMLSNYSLRKILRKIDIIISNEELKELYNILLYYDDSINVDAEYEEISFSDKPKISLKNLNIEKIKNEFSNKIKLNFSSQLKINEYYNNITYYYPKDFFKQDNFLYIFWFYNFYILDYIDEYNDNKFKEIIPTELLEFNKLAYDIFKGEINKLDDNTILNNDFKEILIIGYKLLEGIEKVNDKNSLYFSEGIDLIKKSNKHDHEQKVDISLDSIYKIKKYFNDYSNKNKSWDCINKKMEILEKSKEHYIFENAKSEFERRLNNINIDSDKIKEKERFEFLKDEIYKIEILIRNKGNIQEIETGIKDLEKKIIQIRKSEEIQKAEKNELSQILKTKTEEPSTHCKILYNYSKLYSIIDELKNIKIPYIFLNRVGIFEKLIQMRIFHAYYDIIFSECKNNENVTNEIIDIFKHLANSYLINNIIINKLENKFNIYIDNLIRINGNIIKDIGAWR